MLSAWLNQLSIELELGKEALKEKSGSFFFTFNDKAEVEIRDLTPGIALHAKMLPCPKEEGALFTYLMRANCLGQGTGNARLALSEDGKTLTLSSSLPYDLDYELFKLALEEFINYLLFWRGEIEKGTYKDASASHS